MLEDEQKLTQTIRFSNSLARDNKEKPFNIGKEILLTDYREGA
jgi:hypothetical protein